MTKRKSFSFKFRKRIKVAPGVTINLSRSGVSTTLGPKGFSLNVGKNGAHLNAGIPGTGIYNRYKIFGADKKIEPLSNDDIYFEHLLSNIMHFKHFFPSSKLGELRNRFNSLSQKQRCLVINNADLIHPSKVSLMSFFLGWIAIDRFYLKDYTLGVLKIITIPVGIGVCWWCLDVLFCWNKVKKINYLRFSEAIDNARDS
jgi:hypothetical protein|nr:MAG TPA: Protein of unknown function (DUF4236) [Caudoviricetes sp.]DAO20293.1 MAG TPA: Protein of unknown function (DUF4236) [Caudoviricetes sp.]